MYFDALLDRNMIPVYNGTREEIVILIKQLHAMGDPLDRLTVVPGETLETMTVDDYMNRYSS